jgi:hypothetical protein
VEGKFTTKKLRKDEIIARLLDMQITAKGSLKDLQKIATDAGIVIEEIQPKIVEGWVGKAKGLLQVLWERGYIDNADGKAYHKYTMNGTKDVFGNNQPDTSLKLLMESCTDFEEEETMLQSMGREMNILVDRSPKCHCECAGEGIEYSWALMKNYYRRILLDKKRGKENFYNSVRESMSRNHITTERVQMFSRRARRYITAYYVLGQMQEGNIECTDSDDGNFDSSSQILPTKIEQMVKKFKTHRCAMDFDHGFMQSIYNEKSN